MAASIDDKDNLIFILKFSLSYRKTKKKKKKNYTPILKLSSRDRARLPLEIYKAGF